MRRNLWLGLHASQDRCGIGADLKIIGAIIFFGIPIFVVIVLPWLFLRNLDRNNPPDPDMW